MIHFRLPALVGNRATITQAQPNRRSSLTLLVNRPSHGDSFIGVPASYLVRSRISDPLKASMGVLSATSHVRSANYFPLACLIAQAVAELKLHRQDASLPAGVGMVRPFLGPGLSHLRLGVPLNRMQNDPEGCQAEANDETRPGADGGCVGRDEERRDSQEDARDDAEPRNGAHQGPASVPPGRDYDAICPDVPVTEAAGREGDEAV